MNALGNQGRLSAAFSVGGDFIIYIYYSPIVDQAVIVYMGATVLLVESETRNNFFEKEYFYRMYVKERHYRCIGKL